MSDWRREPVGSVLKIRYGKALDKAQRDPQAPIPVVGSAGIMTYTATALVESPALVIGRKGNIGEAHLFAGGCWPIDTTYYAEVPETIDAKFLEYQFEVLDLRRLDSSTTTPSLRREDLEAAELSIPPLDEQRRIVAILEDHLSRLDAAVASLDAAAQKIDAWRDAEVEAALWAPGVETAPILTLLREPMRNGRSDRAAPDGRGTRTLTITAVTKNDFSDGHTKITHTSPGAAAGLWLEPGDIFVQRSNTPELVGSAARYDGSRYWAIFPDLLIRLRADESKVTSEYLAAALRSRRVHRALRAKAKGLAGSMPKIDQGAIGNTAIPVVAVPEQRVLVSRLEGVERSAQRSLVAIDAQRRRARALRRSLLAAAFRGHFADSADFPRAP